MLSLRRNVLVLLLAVLGVACATPGRIMVAPLWAPALIPSEQGEANLIEAAFARLMDHERALGIPAPLPTIIITTADKHASYRMGMITLPRRALSGGESRRYWHAVASHEGGHAYWLDARDCPVGQHARCEDNANFHARYVLVHGFGYEESVASRMVWEYLRAGVVGSAKRTSGHEDWCREIHAYELRAYVPPVTLYPCEEIAAGR
jgi:hypothetical protein